jgi:histidinol-phosphate aminotransferase
VTYVPGKSAEELRRESGIERVVKLGSNENPLGPSPLALAALEAALADVNRYPGLEAEALRVAIGERWGIQPAQVVIGNGSCDVIVTACAVAASAGGEVVIPRHGFQMYEIVARWAGADCVFTELQDYALDLDAIAAAVSARTRVVFVTNPNNPTGLAIERSDLDAFLDRLPASVLVVLDEAYGEYADPPERCEGVAYVAAGRNVLVTRTFSKLYGLAGLRVGYGIGPPALVRAIEARQPPFHTGRQALAAAAGALADDGFYRRSRELNAQGRRFLTEALGALGLRVLPSQANHVLVVGLMDTDRIDRELQERGVIVRLTDASFGLPGCIRVTIGTPDENEVFLAAFTQAFAKAPS